MTTWKATVKKQSFFDSFECRSGSHCRICRSRTDGIMFRASISKYFEVTADIAGESSFDWSCPHGREWGFDEDVKPVPCSSPITSYTSLPISSVPRIGGDCSDCRLAVIRQTCFTCKATGTGCRFSALTPCRQRKLLQRFSALTCYMKKW